ncbi:spore protease YyaC [Tuberibacillus calidus]|jgi:putative sporulation protein YyaC|uniref:spore protease YyaC n=1 Tax=Tuberibacillus calidus TaxID=340097 RepID=UPI0003F5DDA7|nr:spore protease YyaC [Tuberibacillus calidus]
MSLKGTIRTFIKGNEDRISYKDPTSRVKLSKELDRLLKDVDSTRPIVIVSIGTDRSTGDSLGPLVGTHLLKFKDRPYVVYGTLEEPVHAINLKATLKEISERYCDPFIIAIDACLGRHYNIGTITAARGPLIPGAGVKKDLPPVGHIHITGIVNVSGYMEYIVLQNTRLSLVMGMAEVIGDCVHYSLKRHFLSSSPTKITFK